MDSHTSETDTSTVIMEAGSVTQAIPDPEPVVDLLAQEAMALAREVVLEEDEDESGLSNADKWNFVQEQLDEVRTGGFFHPLDFENAYEWEVGGRLLAYGFVANLRSQVFGRLFRKAKTDESKMRCDYHLHTHTYYFLLIKDKYEAIKDGKKVWKHRWLN